MISSLFMSFTFFMHIGLGPQWILVYIIDIRRTYLISVIHHFLSTEFYQLFYSHCVVIIIIIVYYCDDDDDNFFYIHNYENKELEVKGHAENSPLILGPSEGVQNVVNKATEFMYGELHWIINGYNNNIMAVQLPQFQEKSFKKNWLSK